MIVALASLVLPPGDSGGRQEREPDVHVLSLIPALYRRYSEGFGIKSTKSGL